MMKKIKRREFLKLAGASVASLSIPDELMANDGTEFSDYKAIVVLDLRGGNDSLNMFIPTDTTTGIKTGYDSYANIRANKIRVEAKDLMGDLKAKVQSDGYLGFSSTSDHPYYTPSEDISDAYVKGFYLHDNYNFNKRLATNAMMPELAYWVDRGKCAIIQNAGLIKQPMTKADIRADGSLMPPFIFSHSHQHTLMTTGQASSINVPTGPFGRVADKWQKVNGDSIYGLNINLSRYGSYRMFFGSYTMPMNYSYLGPTTIAAGSAYENELMSLPRGNIYQKYYNKTRKKAILEVEETLKDWESITGSNDVLKGMVDMYGNPITTSSSAEETVGVKGGVSSYDSSLLTVARLIKLGKEKGLKRQVFSILLGGFDQHGGQPIQHPQRLRGVSIAIDKFMRSMENFGLSDSVTLFNVSEFSRAIGSSSYGTSHGWGGHYFALGGAVKGGVYGDFPELVLGGDQDYSRKGRLIPSISMTQYYATIIKWFGADEDVLNHALPELKNFSQTDLGFMKS
jgi:uncharacterized protein (DUF1501 family)